MKTRTQYTCKECGAVSPRWLGRCAECGAWNSLEEQEVVVQKNAKGKAIRVVADDNLPTPLPEIVTPKITRLTSGIAEFDRTLGGGLVPGSTTLLAGDPGIGKSTILLQVAGRLAETYGKVLYISGEESLHQTKRRAERLGIASPNLYLLYETRLEAMLHHAEQLSPVALMVDSVQTVAVPGVESTPGSITQVRESAAQLIRHAKASETPTFLVGHVTKEGAIAGPKVLEHMVDTVLSFEGDQQHAYRLIRAQKNRFGSTNELGVFEMRDDGLTEVPNPSALFLSERQEGVSGSAVVCVMEGTRPLLLELQALVSPTRFGTPMRVAAGLDRNRLALLIAVLEKRGRLSAQNADVFVNVTGGVTLDEPAADLGLMMAMASSLKDEPIDAGTVFIGEVGLGGEVRAVSRIQQRLTEAAKLGFQRALVPRPQAGKVGGIQVVGVRNLREALDGMERQGHGEG